MEDPQLKIKAALADAPWTVGPRGISVQRGKDIVALRPGELCPEASKFSAYDREFYLRAQALVLPEGYASDINAVVNQLDEAKATIAALQQQVAEYEALLSSATTAPAPDPRLGQIIGILRTDQVPRVAGILGVSIELPAEASAEQARAILAAALGV